MGWFSAAQVAEMEFGFEKKPIVLKFLAEHAGEMP